jgi:hypothetical protein
MESPVVRIFAKQQAQLENGFKYMVTEDYMNAFSEEGRIQVSTGTAFRTLNTFVNRVQEKTIEELTIVNSEDEDTLELEFISDKYQIDTDKKQLFYDQVTSELHKDSEPVKEEIDGISKIVLDPLENETVELHIDTDNPSRVGKYYQNHSEYTVRTTRPEILSVIRDLTSSEKQLITEEDVFQSIPDHISVSEDSSTKSLTVTIHFKDSDAVLSRRIVRQEFIPL